jgi:hypothetical protein
VGPARTKRIVLTPTKLAAVNLAKGAHSVENLGIRPPPARPIRLGDVDV